MDPSPYKEKEWSKVFGPSNWKNGVAFNKRVGGMYEGGLWGRDNQEPGFVHAKFQMEI